FDSTETFRCHDNAWRAKLTEIAGRTNRYFDLIRFTIIIARKLRELEPRYVTVNLLNRKLTFGIVQVRDTETVLCSIWSYRNSNRCVYVRQCSTTLLHRQAACRQCRSRHI